MNSQTYSRTRTPSDRSRRVETILIRYPDVSEQDIDLLVEEIPRLPILELGLLTADERLAGRLEAFHRDHGSRLRTSWSSAMVFLFVPACLFIGLLWWGVHNVALG